MGKRYKVFPLKASDKAEFLDATAEELRLLIALIERGGDGDEGALAKASGITLGRCKASLRFWSDAGVISEERSVEGEIIDEITVEEQQENEVRIPLDKNYEQGYIAGLMEAFEGVPAEPNGNIGYALGIFSAMFDIRCDRSFTYSGAKR